MTLHTLVHSCDSFSCNCNSIQFLCVNCDLRAFSSFLFLWLRVYISYSDFPIKSLLHLTSSMYSNVTTSTRINIFKCTYVHHRSFHSYSILNMVYTSSVWNLFNIQHWVCWPIMQQNWLTLGVWYHQLLRRTPIPTQNFLLHCQKVGAPNRESWIRTRIPCTTPF